MNNNGIELTILDMQKKLETCIKDVEEIKKKNEDILLAAKYNAHETYNAMQLKHYHGRTLVFGGCSGVFIALTGLAIKYNFSGTLIFCSLIIMIICCFLFALSFIFEVISMIRVEKMRRKLK